jgi:hypothetical protein
MTTLTEVLALASEHGYTASFRAVDGDNLQITDGARNLSPEDVRIPNFYRFEGASNPDDMAILYLIETNDGFKGALVDAYGTYSDEKISEFVKAVTDIQKSEAQ